MYLLPREKKSVKGKLAIITGAGNGLGKAVSLKLAHLGCNIAVVDVNKSAADETAKEVIDCGVKAKAYKVDVTKADQIIQLRDDVEKDFGDVDILINNAGIVALNNLEEGPEYLEAVVKVNLLGVILMTKYFLEKMRSQGSGHIVSISSLGGLHATPFITPYCATKFGVNGFMQGLTEHLRLEKLDDKIKTTCIFPSFTKTIQAVEDFLNPNVRMAVLEPNQVAESIVNIILTEKTSATIPEYYELGAKFVQLLPLKLQQKLYRDRILNEYNFKNSKI
ncbi:17-beta-hydroxysteroid dehydrogenase 13-like [Chironomus tepperi]|uniref:17-beta-hydroxysteroid dehydrogenase 13-like n=1 Tax=Chironomus tepperi TaxID=113505 RepID=UPI00391FBFE5